METAATTDVAKSKYAKYKLVIKRWEKHFHKTTGRPPSKHDFKEADEEVRRAYHRYFNLKYEILEGALGDALESSPKKGEDASPAPPSPVPPSPAPCVDEPVLLPTLDQITRLTGCRISQEPAVEVWGDHLNRSAEADKKKNAAKKTLDLSRVSQKLFDGSSFKKRNPRRALDRSKSGLLDDSKVDELNSSQTVGEVEVSEPMKALLDQFPSTPIPSTPIPSTPIPSTPVDRPQVRNVDPKWVERCSEKVVNHSPLSPLQVQNKDVSQSKPSYGLRNITVAVPVQRENVDDDFSDCIENSESENEDSQKSNKKYERIKPIVKKRKVEETRTSDKDDKSKKKINTTKSDSSREKKKSKGKMTKGEQKKKSNKSSSPKTLPKRADEELNGLTDRDVEMPRFVINRAKLKDDDIIDGLVSALELPKKLKKKSSKADDGDGPLTKAEEKLQAKIESGSLNDNFVRINIEKKVYVRGKKTMNFSKFKKKQWKDKKKALNALGPEFPEGGVLKCFKCDQTGHFARYCTAHKGNELLPLADADDKSTHKTLEEVEESIQRIVNICNEKFLFQPISESDETTNEVQNPEPERVPETFMKLLAASDENAAEKFTARTVLPVYSVNSDSVVPEATAEVKAALAQFGYASFRSGQERAIMRILSGRSTLVTLSTGSGKSLCYQLPAYIYSKHHKCITLVVSPLVSLMEDQVVNMPSFLRAGCLHTNQPPKQREKIIDLIKNGDINVLLISPEAVSSERSTGFGGILKQLPPIAFVCIDEVHCVSQWSHNFRPSYLMISRVLREKLGVNCILGLTATATTATVESILEHIGIPDKLNGVISNTPIPDNLVLTVSKDKDRDKAILELLVAERFKNCDSIIIYCIRRDECERIASIIRTSLINYRQNSSNVENVSSNRKRKRFDWLVESYHAGMSGAKRKKVQQAFMNGDLKIVVATVAFGMGINKSDIRAVIHYNMPRSFESYVQEVGRAGRDGLPAQCHAFIDFNGKDKHELLRHIHADSIERHVIRKLLQKIFIPCACKAVKSSSNEEIRKCNGHEVAFPIDETVRELDLPSENICTLLCYLELHANKYIKMLSNVYIMCKIMSYGGPSAIIEAAQNCPPLAMAIALEKSKGKNFHNIANFEFCVIDVAAAIGWQSGLVKYNLKNLEWDKTGSKIKRSLLQVEFHTLGFRVMAPGDLGASELDVALDSVYERTQLQEKTMLHQLQHISQTLSGVAFNGILECSKTYEDPAFKEKSDVLKKCIQEYFAQEGKQTLLTIDSGFINEQLAISDIRGLISAYRDCTFTGRAVARILQGITSPNFPAIVWGKCRYWRSHIMSDFYKLTEIAKQQIMQMR